MDVFTAIYERRSCRDYTAAPVPRESLLRLLSAATQAPSALNLQPWGFAVFQGKTLLQEMSQRTKDHLVATLSPTFELHLRSDLYARAEYDIFHGANTLVVIYATHHRFYPTEDCAMAAQNFMLGAHALGLATCPIGFARSWFDLSDVKRKQGIPEHYTAVMPMVVGFPAHTPPAVSRLEPEIITWKSFDAERLS